ncbi:catabolite gene activator protein [Spirochaetia bacterium]|nr:catabolite gene activator protein [Spirochaetia bacterium]
MPKTVQCQAGAIVYFLGEDSGEKIYLLQSGTVNLAYQNIETGANASDPVQTGEFFGVKAALGRYPQEENAIVTGESTIIVFTIPEFEQLVGANPRIIIKMLKVFSNQLRRVHRHIAHIMVDKGYDPEDSEQSLFKVGEYYFKNKRNSQAEYIFGRYLTHYPAGKNAALAVKFLNTLHGITGAAFNGAPKVPEPDITQNYYDAVSFISQGKFQQAFVLLKKIQDGKGDPEYVAKSSYETGRCLFMMDKFDECIQHFTQMLTSYPKHPRMGDALFFVAKSFEKGGEKDRAVSFYRKILSMVPGDEDPLTAKTKRALTALGEV